MVTDTDKDSPSYPKCHHTRLLYLVKHFQRSTKHFALTLNLVCSSKFYSEVSTNQKTFSLWGEIIAVHPHLHFSDCFLYLHMCQIQIFVSHKPSTNCSRKSRTISLYLHASFKLFFQIKKCMQIIINNIFFNKKCQLLSTKTWEHIKPEKEWIRLAELSKGLLKAQSTMTLNI